MEKHKRQKTKNVNVAIPRDCYELLKEEKRKTGKTICFIVRERLEKKDTN